RIVHVPAGRPARSTATARTPAARPRSNSTRKARSPLEQGGAGLHGLRQVVQVDALLAVHGTPGRADAGPPAAGPVPVERPAGDPERLGPPVDRLAVPPDRLPRDRRHAQGRLDVLVPRPEVLRRELHAEQPPPPV